MRTPPETALTGLDALAYALTHSHVGRLTVLGQSVDECYARATSYTPGALESITLRVTLAGKAHPDVRAPSTAPTRADLALAPFEARRSPSREELDAAEALRRREHALYETENAAAAPHGYSPADAEGCESALFGCALRCEWSGTSLWPSEAFARTVKGVRRYYRRAAVLDVLAEENADAC